MLIWQVGFSVRGCYGCYMGNAEDAYTKHCCEVWHNSLCLLWPMDPGAPIMNTPGGKWPGGSVNPSNLLQVVDAWWRDSFKRATGRSGQA
jgi:hypothetical protein